MGRARKSATVTERDREITAWHEAGHALAALLIPEAHDPAQVTIVPRGSAGGVMWMGGDDASFLSDALARARALLAAHRPFLETVVADLLAEETLDLDRMRELLTAVEGAPSTPPAAALRG